MKNNMTMEKTLELFKEYKSLAGKNDAASEARKAEIGAWMEAHRNELPKDDVKAFMGSWLDEIGKDVADIKHQALKEQLDREAYRMIPLKVVAEKYFGKSAAWLTQRLSGTPVRGKVYTLNAEQKRIFNGAMKDIGGTIGSIRLA